MSDQPKGVFIDDVEFPFDDSSSILAFTDKALGDKIIPTLCNDDNLQPYGACRVCSVEVQQCRRCAKENSRFMSYTNSSWNENLY